MAAFNDILIRIITTPRKWTWQNVIGTVLLVFGYVLPRVVSVSPELSNICDQAYFIGGVLGLFGAAAPIPGVAPKVEVSRGFARLPLLCALALAGILAALLSGCASTERNGDTIDYRLRDDPERAWPACLYRFGIDGDWLHHGKIGTCPEVPVCREVKP